MIRSFRIPAHFARNHGLHGPKEPLHNLGKLIVLAGPNGAGKTRFLRLLQGLSYQATTALQELKQQQNVREIQLSLIPDETDHDIDAQERKILQTYKKELASINQNIKFIEEINFESSGTDPKFIDLSYKAVKQRIQDLTRMSSQMIRDQAQACANPGFDTAHQGMHAYFGTIAKALWNSRHPDIASHPSTIQGAEDARLFNEILDALIGGCVGYEIDNMQEVLPTFRDRRFQPGELSDGEAILITWAIILHKQGRAIADSIIIIDEPENHLHPDACIRALSGLRDKVLGPHGQIWLATHSVQLISFAGIESIYLVSNGHIEYGGNQVDRVIDRLLGGPKGRNLLKAFLSDGDVLGFYKFAAECLQDPTVAPHKTSDPQQAQFVELTQQRISEGKPLRVLDYGAGRGRLAKALHQTCSTDGNKASEPQIAYFAYNGSQASVSEKDECKLHLEELNKSPNIKAIYVDDIRKYTLPSTPKMDVVILCNVLHEIPIDKWLSMFSDIQSILDPAGVVLVMEDQSMKLGELPSTHGFLVMDEIELAALFNAEPGHAVRALPSRPTGRITQIEIKRNVLSNISTTTIGDALHTLMERAKREIEVIRSREEPPTMQSGRLHAYYAMLYTNAALAQGTYPKH